MKNIIALFITITSFVCMQSKDNNFWKTTNGPFASKVTALATNHNGIIYCGSQFEGVFRSSDNGENWKSLGLGNRDITAILTLDSGNVYVATATYGLYHFKDLDEEWTYLDSQSPNNFITSLATDLDDRILVGTSSDGLYKASGNGTSWFQVGNGLDATRVNTIEKDESTGNVFVGTDIGLYNSTDNSFSYSYAGLSGNINSVAISQNGHIFVATNAGIFSSENDSVWQQLSTFNTRILTVNSNGHIFAGTEDMGLYRSKNNGNDWTQINDGLTYSMDVRAIIINPNNYVLTGTGGGVYSSVDNGKNWKQRNNGLGYSGHPNANVLSLCTVNNNLLFIGTLYGGVYKSMNYGENWIPFNKGLPNNLAVKYFSYNSQNQVFAATSKGIYTLKNNDSLWIKTAFNDAVNTIFINSNDSIFACAYEGLYISEDTGNTWEKTSLKNGKYEVNVYTLVQAKNNYLWAGTVNRIYLSKNNGSVWEKVDSVQSYLQCMAINNFNGIFTGAQQGLFRSLDGGRNWVKVLEKRISSIIITSSGNIYAGSYGGGVDLSFDNGDNWKSINQGLQYGFRITLEVDSVGYMYAGLGSREGFAGGGGGVAKSINLVTSIQEDIVLSNTIDKTTINLQNYPNPFNALTNIKFNLPFTTKVKLQIFDLSGKTIATLINNKRLSAGQHIYSWDAEKKSTGIYFCRLIINNKYAKVQKIIYLK